MFAVYGDNDGRLSMKRPAFLSEATWWGRYPTPLGHRAAPVQQRVTQDFVVFISHLQWFRLLRQKCTCVFLNCDCSNSEWHLHWNRFYVSGLNP